MDLPAGQVIARVGHNGSGKTGMYDLHRTVADLCLPQCPLKCMPARFETINFHYDR
jgi:hypothetical protein